MSKFFLREPLPCPEPLKVGCKDSAKAHAPDSMVLSSLLPRSILYKIGRRMHRFLMMGCVVSLLPGCSVQRAMVAQDAREKMVGLDREQILACMGPPVSKASEGGTEVWSYGSGNDRTTSIGTGYAQTEVSAVAQRRGDQVFANGSATTASATSVTSTRRHCTVNVVMTAGRVTSLSYSGATGGILTGGEQCAFAVQNCVQR